MAGTINLDGVELTISENTTNDVTLAEFGGFMGFIGQIAEEYGGKAGKKVALVLEVTSGVITGVFDKDLNPQKGYNELIGSALTGAIIGRAGGWAGAETGLLIGGAIGGPVGAVVGAAIGGIAGGLYGDDLYKAGENIFLHFASLNRRIEVDIPSRIYGKLTQQEFIVHSLINDPNFTKRMYPEYLEYRQIVEIKDYTTTLRYNLGLKKAEIVHPVNAEQVWIDFLKHISETTDAKIIKHNNEVFDIRNLSTIELRNAVSHIDSVSFLLSEINIRVGEKLDMGSFGIYTVKGGDTLSEIAASHGMVTKDLVMLNTWLIDDGRIDFLYPTKVLVDAGTIVNSVINHTLAGTMADEFEMEVA